MARLPRVLQKIFGSTASTGDIRQFGSFAAGTPVTTTDIAQIQGLSNWLAGWRSAVVANNAPTLQDTNAALFVITQQLAYLMERGIPEWEANTTYYQGSIVQSVLLPGELYVSLTDNNLNHPTSDGSNWAQFFSVPGPGTVDSSKIAAGAVLSAALGSNLNLPGKAVKENGSNLVVSNSNAANSLAIIRAQISGTSIINGEGCTVTNPSAGHYTVTFSAAFGDNPVVVASAIGADATIQVNTPSTGAVSLLVYDRLGNQVNNDFSIIAIGQRA